MLPAALAAWTAFGGETVRNPPPATIAVWWHTLAGEPIPYEDWAKSVAAREAPNDFERPRVQGEVVARFKAAAETIKHLDTLELTIDIHLSAYDHEHGCYHLDFFPDQIWRFTSNLTNHPREYGVQLDNPEDFFVWNVSAEEAKKHFTTGGLVTALVKMKVLRAEPGSRGFADYSVLIAHATSADMLLYGRENLGTIKAKTAASAATVPSANPGTYDIQGLRPGMTRAEIIAAAAKAGLQTAEVRQGGSPTALRIPGAQTESHLPLVFYTGELVCPQGFRWSDQGLPAESNPALISTGAIGFDWLPPVGSSLVIVQFTSKPRDTQPADLAAEIRFRQSFEYANNRDAEKVLAEIKSDLLKTYGAPKKQETDHYGYKLTWGESGRDLSAEFGERDGYPLRASLSVGEGYPDTHNFSRRTSGSGPTKTMVVADLTATFVEPKTAPAATPAPEKKRLFGRTDTDAPSPAPTSPTAAPVEAENNEVTSVVPAAPSTPATVSVREADEHLNRSYRKLREHLSPADQKALLQEQRDWLRQYGAIKNEGERARFGEQRAQAFDARLSAGGR